MDDTTFFRDATTQICRSLYPNILLERCYKFLKNFMPMDFIGICIHEPKDKSINVINFFSKIELPPGIGNKPIALSPEEWDFVTTFKEKYHIVNDAKSNPIGRHVCEAAGINDLSYMALLIYAGRDTSCIISVIAKGCDRYTAEHGRLLGLLEDPFSIAVFNALQHQELVRLKDLLNDDNRYLYHELLRNVGDEIIGTSQSIKNIMEVVSHISGFSNLVMLFGETGVGKEVIANAIHYNSPRANGPFIKVNCGAIPDNLIDSHLFGHEKGSFTGAISNNRGHFERAHNGTLFLDEIGDLPIAVQGRLLGVLETKEIERVGGTQTIKVDVRIIAATHHNLEEMVRKGEFREDLWFRLNVFPITIPPLRQRREDIPALIEYFIRRKSRELNLKHLPSISAKTIKRMQAYDWPGNVRELANVVERELIWNVIGSQNTLMQFDEFLQHAETASTKSVTKESSVPLSLDEVNRQHFHRILQLTGGKINGKNGAAEILRLNPCTLRHRLRKLGIPFGRLHT